MKIVVQRVSRAAVRVDGQAVARIGPGLLLLVAVERGDDDDAVSWSARKVAGMRIFPDDDGKMNRSVQEVKGAVLAVSQFTLAGSLRRGRRPSFEGAAPPEEARALYDRFVEHLDREGLAVQSGVFRAHMEVEGVNDGPVTLIVDSAERLRPRDCRGSR
ncbi:MAG: D-aminoacyl-tRNA deacylase [Acidobacteriota bacterium]